MLFLLAMMASQETIRVPAPPPPQNVFERRVEIGSARFRVVVKDSTAEVYRRNFFFNADAQHYVMVRQAAELASGCKAIEHFTPSGISANPVSVLLNCSLDADGRDLNQEDGRPTQ